MPRKALVAAALVTELAVVTTAGLLAGDWVDQQLDTSPLVLLLLTVASFSLAMVRLVQGLNRFQEPDEPRPPNDDA